MSSESLKSSSVDEKTFQHNLIQKEFRDLLENSEYKVSEDTEAIMILSKSPRGWHTKDNESEDHPEDIANIKFGFEVYKEIASKKLNKPIIELTGTDLSNPLLPFFVLNGATEQQIMMERIARSLDVPQIKTLFLNCGDHADANTKTQFTKIPEHPIISKLKNITLVTTSYHVPRVARTAAANLDKDIDFDVLGVPMKDFPFDVFRNVKGEAKRIIAYSKKGDIAKLPRNQETKS